MKINIINLSDTPAKISSEEIKNGLDFLNSKDFVVDFEYDSLENVEKGLIKFNNLISLDEDELILFTSGGFTSINYINKITNSVGNGKKIILGYSDLSHIQYKYLHEKNVYIFYGITLRNIFSLDNASEKQLLSFIKNNKLSIKLRRILGDSQINGSIIGGHLMIFTCMYDNFRFDGDILFLEFHGLESYFVFYLLDVLKLKGIFNKVNCVILDSSSNDLEGIFEYFDAQGIKDILVLEKSNFIPFFKEVIIKGEHLIYKV